MEQSHLLQEQREQFRRYINTQTPHAVHTRMRRRVCQRWSLFTCRYRHGDWPIEYLFIPLKTPSLLIVIIVIR